MITGTSLKMLKKQDANQMSLTFNLDLKSVGKRPVSGTLRLNQVKTARSTFYKAFKDEKVQEGQSTARLTERMTMKEVQNKQLVVRHDSDSGLSLLDPPSQATVADDSLVSLGLGLGIRVPKHLLRTQRI